MAIRDPWANRIMILVLIVFTSLATVAILYRLLFEPQHEPYPARFLLPLSLGAALLFAVFFPRPPQE